MPRKSTKTDSITLSKDQLDALIAQSVQAHLAAKTTQTDGQTMAEAFAGAMRPILQGTDDNTKAMVQRVLEQTGRKENDLLANPRISAFNPLGDKDHPRPRLVDGSGKPRKVFFCGEPSHDLQEQMTRDEIEAFNSLHEDADIEKAGGAWKVRIKKNGTTEELSVELPMANRDLYLHFPSRLAILQELRLGKKVTDVNKLFAKMIANSTDPDAFIAALQKLAEGTPASV